MEFFFDLLEIFLEILTLVVLFRVVISWVSPGQTNQLTSLLYLVTEPMMAPLRKILPRFGRIDLAPAAVIIIIRVLILIIYVIR